MRLLATAALAAAVGQVAAAPVAAQSAPDAPAAPYGPPTSPLSPEGALASAAIPAVLENAVGQAILTHPRVAAADAEVDALSAELRGARSGFLPSVSVEALAATSGSSFADRDGLTLNAVLEQPLWAGGRIDAQIDRARAGLGAGEDRLFAAQRQIVLDVVQAYQDYLLSDHRLTVLQGSLEQHRLLVASIGRRVAQEVSPRADLTLGTSRAAQVELDIASAQELFDNARLRLFELTGMPDIAPVLPQPGLSALLPAEEVALAETLACDPGIASLLHVVDVSEADRAIARSQLFPQILAQLSQNEITGTRAALVLRLRLGSGTSQFSAVDASNARILRAVAQLGEAQLLARENLRRDYIMVRAYTARISAGTLAADAADEIVASYQRQFVAGRRSWLDVMNGVREAANARLSEGDARVMAAMGIVRILARTCRWQPRASEPQP